jgi:NAD(P)-dependent dehydrogenase (short-subunit alcohol dehydrogenase family)
VPLFICSLIFEGIGQATAIALSRDGCTQLVLGDINLTGLEETKRKVEKANHNAVVEVIHLDVTKEESVESFHTKAVSKFGRIDFAINSVGYGHPATPTHNLSEEEWDRSYRVNQRGVRIYFIFLRFSTGTSRRCLKKHD